jgi:hypothetical protein
MRRLQRQSGKSLLVAVGIPASLTYIIYAVYVHLAIVPSKLLLYDAILLKELLEVMVLPLVTSSSPLFHYYLC